ncbi:hypothetical protein CSCA_2437 [Clostridium scatologenes]|uniref:Uncharacterized protein n=1 Tax=Clostridium scatologenes TaxID=1548 RepID=A0A0E3GQ58_CLOSL|nr:hypothetical protein CSCA_0871 [Clostridium scatologenes]AKA69562.1 hypothetical protein CSCA_2437 [Clostridium scatologenes]
MDYKALRILTVELIHSYFYWKLYEQNLHNNSIYSNAIAVIFFQMFNGF